MNCVKCNTALPEGKLFCPTCGHLNEANKQEKTHEQKTSMPFTSSHHGLGIFLCLALSVLFLGWYYYKLFQEPLVPALQHRLLYVHVPFGLISYASIIGALIVSVIASFRSLGTPTIVYRLQIIAVTLFAFCVLTGSIWAKTAWGIAWHWEPKELVSLIVLCIMIFCTVFMSLSKPGVKGSIALFFVESISIIYLWLVSVIYAGFHAYNAYGDSLAVAIVNMFTTH